MGEYSKGHSGQGKGVCDTFCHVLHKFALFCTCFNLIEQKPALEIGSLNSF